MRRKQISYPVLLFVFLAHAFLNNIAQGQRNLKDIPDPDPELERQTFILADGFEANLFAGDPQLAKPIHMNFDERGRLWIAGSSVYPHIKPGQPATDKILVLEDTDGDGKSDKTTVFADGLLIPTGIAPAKDGCYVANSTELVHLIDTDGDGKADQKKIILSGFGTEDTHHLLHSLRWGHDGCLYMNQSIYIHSHVETPYGVKRLNGGGIWRFRPETLELEVLCEGFVNPWGHHFDRWGQNFVTDGAYGEGINYAFPGSVFVTAPGAKRILKGLNPGSPKHCGLEIIGGRHLPDEFRGNMITNDFRAHRVCRFVVSENGTSAFASRQETELIKSTHVAFRPIDVKMGPDGAIYIADWYNPIIQHGEVDFRDPRRDHVHGRIWRLTYKGRSLLKHPDLVNSSIEELLAFLKVPEEWVRLHAKRMLKRKPQTAVASAIETWMAQLQKTDPDYEHHLLEALWTHQSIRVPNAELLKRLTGSEDHRVRAAALRVISDWRDELSNDLVWNLYSEAARDDHPRVRLEAVRGLASIPKAKAVTASLAAMEKGLDFYLDFALWRTVRELEPFWLPELRKGSFDYNNDTAQLTFALAAIDSPEAVAPLLKMAIDDPETPDRRRLDMLEVVASQGTAEQLGRVAETVIDIAAEKPEFAKQILQRLTTTSRQRNLIPAFEKKDLLPLLENLKLRPVVANAVGVWKIQAGRERLEQLAGQGSLAAIDGLANLGGPAAKQKLLELTQPKQPIVVRQRAANVLTMLDVELAAKTVAQLLKESPPGLEPAAALDFLLKTKGGAAAVQKSVSRMAIDAESAKLAVRAIQASPTPDKKLIEAIRSAGRLDSAKWVASPALTTKLVKAVQSKGDAKRGELIYRRQELQCLNCHAIAGAGGIVGPEMNSIGASAQIDYLIESLLEPNRKVKENYNSIVVQTIDGLQYSGIAVRESDEQIVLRTAESKLITIPVNDIEAKKDGRSLMPEGLVDSLTESELVDLVSFLSQLGKVGDFAISNRSFARNWETLVWTPEANRRLNRTSFDTAATNDSALSWKPEYALVDGSVDIASLPKFKIHRNTPPTSFLRASFKNDVPGDVVLRIADPDRSQIWIDGKPRKTGGTMKLNLDAGQHAIVVAVTNKNGTRNSVELVADESVPVRWVQPTKRSSER